MRKLLLLLGVLCCCATTAAMAGYNAGGVLWVHDTGITVTSDPITWPGDPAVIGCPTTSVDSEIATVPLPGATAKQTYWKVYAAFPVGTSPRLKSVGWGIEYDTNVTSAYSYVNVVGGSVCNGEVAPTTVFFIGAGGWPLSSGSTVGMSFPPAARLTLVTPLFMFWGYGYNYDAATYPCPTFRTALKPGDDNFGDDVIPVGKDQIAGYGSLGFGCPGVVPCPVGPVVDPTGSCCLLSGACSVTVASACTGLWTLAGVCVPNTCEQPPVLGSCCLPTGACLVTIVGDCTGLWTLNGVCEPNTCEQPPVLGSCCLPTGACLVTIAGDCTGIWTLNGVCEPNTCEQPPVLGSCCAVDGSCTVTVQGAVCVGTWTLGGVCDPNTCPPPPPVEGACCWLDGHCTITTLAGCLGDGTPHWTALGVCSPNPCDQPPPPPTGACCWKNGSCTVTTQVGCLGDGTPLWTLNGTCDPNVCTPPVPTERASWGQIKNIYR